MTAWDPSLSGFRIMQCASIKEVPWALISPHERQAQMNHGQTLARLDERGGLSPCEAVAVLEDRRWRRMDPFEADARLGELVREWGK